MNGRIAVLLPSYGRPELCARFISSVRHPLADIYLGVAKDDPQLRSHYLGLGVATFITPKMPYPKWTNYLASLTPGYSAYFTGEDDYICINSSWAKMYLDALATPGIHLVADRCEEDYWPHTAAMSGEWLQALGFLHPDVVNHYHITDVWRDLGDGRSAKINEPCFRHDPPPKQYDPEESASDYAEYLKWAKSPSKHELAELLSNIQ